MSLRAELWECPERAQQIYVKENIIVADPVPKEVLDFLQEVDREVRKARKNKQWRAEYMNAMLYLQDAEEQGKRIGEQRGIEIGEQRGIEIGEQRGIKIGKKRGREQERRKRRAVEKKLKETQQELARLKRAMEDAGSK